MTKPQKTHKRDTSPPWHLLEPWQTTAWLKVDPEKGLSCGEVEERLATHGPNAIPEPRVRNPILMFLGQFADVMIIVLIIAGIVSGLIGDLTDTITIFVIVALNAIIGFIQEFRAERAVAALKRLASPTAQVLREGEIQTIAAQELVPGDLVMLEAGNVVPADLKLLDVARLKVEEAALTGESLPVEKSGALIREMDSPLGDRRNMAYKGTIATYGRGVGIVIATGLNTELGKIAELLRQGKEVKTPLQQRLARFGQRLALLVLAICAIIFVVGLLRGEPPPVDVFDRHQSGRSRHTGSPARRCYRISGFGGTQDGQTECFDSTFTCCGNAGFCDLYLLRQNRHADAKPHACRDFLRRRAFPCKNKQ